MLKLVRISHRIIRHSSSKTTSKINFGKYNNRFVYDRPNQIAYGAFLQDFDLAQKMKSLKTKTKGLENVPDFTFIKTLSIEELTQITKSVESLPMDVIKSPQSLIKALDEASINLLEKSSFGELLELSYAWICAASSIVGGRMIKEDNWTYFAQFPKIFAIKYLSSDPKTIRKMTSKELFSLLFISAKYRSLPITIRIETTDRYKVAPHLEEKCQEMTKDLDLLQIGLFAEMLHKCNVRMESLEETFSKAILEIPEEVLKHELSPLLNLCKILLGTNNPTLPKRAALINKLIQKYEPHMLDLSDNEKFRLLTLIISNPPRFPQMQPFLKSLLKNLQISSLKRSKDLHLLSWAFFKVNYQVYESLDIFHEILEQLKNCDSSHPRYGQHLVQTTCFCAKAGAFDNDLIGGLFEKVNDYKEFKKNKLSTKDCIQFLLTLSRTKAKGFVENEEKFGRVLTIRALYNLAELDLILEIVHPEYKGHRMNKTVRNKLIKLHENYSDWKVENLNTDKDFMHKQLVSLFGGEKVYVGTIIPSEESKKDFLLRLNSQGEALNIPQDFSESLQERRNLISVLDKSRNQKWVCLLLPKFSDISILGPLGPLRLKIDLLTKLGYQVVIIRPQKILEWKKKGHLTRKDFESMIEASSK